MYDLNDRLMISPAKKTTKRVSVTLTWATDDMVSEVCASITEAIISHGEAGHQLMSISATMWDDKDCD